MGASFETTYVPDSNNAQLAFSLACDRAYYESGHDSYNGSITTTNGFFIASPDHVPLQQATRLTRIMASDKRISKRGKAAAIPVAHEDSFKSKTLEFSLTSSSADRWEIHTEAETYASKILSDEEFLDSVEIVRIEPVWRSTIVRTTGRPKFMYQVSTKDKEFGTYASKTEAVSLAKELASAQMSKLAAGADARLASPVMVIPVASVDGSKIESSVVFKPELESCRVFCRAKVLTPKSKATQAGWFFYYWAAS